VACLLLIGLPSEEGRCLFQDLALVLKDAHLASERPQLLLLAAGQPIIAVAVIEFGLTKPVAQGLLGNAQVAGDLAN
jgi:hypothetical protein